MLDRSRREINIGPAVSRDRRHREMEAGPVFHATVWCGESPGEPLPSPCLGLLADSHTVRVGILQYSTVMKHRITLWCRAADADVLVGIGCVVKHRNAASHRTKPERLVPARHGRLCSLCSKVARHTVICRCSNAAALTLLHHGSVSILQCCHVVCT